MTPEEAERQSERLLRELHALMAAGLGDTPAADAVRDRSDGPWRAMTDAGRERIGRLSEALYGERNDA